MDDPVLRIRRASRHDAAVVRRLRIDMLTESPQAFDAGLTEALMLDEAAWVTWIGEGSAARAVWLAERAGSPIGSVTATVHDGECRIGALWVDGAYRGRGVGAMLLHAAETWGQGLGCRWAALSVAERNDAAQRLYLRRGYALTGAVKLTRWGHCELYMHKTLGP